MATLQKLRNMGPLLVIFVGLALFAFIAGDAWRLFQSNTADQSVGSVNGEKLSAMEFQKLYEEYTNVFKFARGVNSPGEDELNQIKDEVWNTYIYNKLIAAEAEKIGLTATVAELQAVIDAGTDPILMQTPFRNQQGLFDKDILNNFLVQYDLNKDNAQFVEQYKPAYDYWKFIEKTMMQNILINKYQALIQNSFIGNPIVAKSNFEINNSTYDIEVAAYPYAAIKDEECAATDSDIKELYNQKKEIYKIPAEERNIKYVSFHVTPGNEDREALNAEITEWADSLKAGNEDYATIARLSGSEVAYSELAWQKSAYPEEVQTRIETEAINTVVGPFYNQSDDSYTVFKTISKSTVADSIQYRMLAVSAETPAATATLADSIMQALNSGANYKEIAKKYGQEGSDSIWLTSAQYEGAPIVGNDATLLNTLLTTKKGIYTLVSLDNTPAKFIIQVLDSKNPVEKYNAIVIKRTTEFSSDTYNDAYNKFSQYVASCKTIADLEKNAEEYGYRVMTQNRITTGTHKVANLSGTRDAIKWIFDAKEDEVSPLYECGANDYLLVAGLASINEKGYTDIELLKPILTHEATNNKKADKIIKEIKGKSIEELKKDANVKTCETKRISFSAPSYISATATTEPAINAAVTQMNIGEVSAPIKGNSGVYVIKLIAKNSKGAEFNSKVEEEKMKAQGERESGRFLNTLVQDAEIEDNRYKFF
ncbi:MAG: SurA N-terminal domain-containing protein [Bacteroidaceae bacterium]|nr:SurA N-terminal domain-containing protein [Bacteroidaceae bacterium]